MEARDYASSLSYFGIQSCSFDFTGSGKSEGEYVTLGLLEAQDINAVIDFLVTTNKVSSVGLWGRSMGAVSAIIHAASDSRV